MFGPVLRGGKVTLRPPDESDPARFVEPFADTEVTRYLGRAFAVALHEELEWFKRIGESKSDVVWMIEAEGRATGSIGIHHTDWVNANGVTGTMIGDKSAWRKGYGSEAMRLRTCAPEGRLSRGRDPARAQLPRRSLARPLAVRGPALGLGEGATRLTPR